MLLMRLKINKCSYHQYYTCSYKNVWQLETLVNCVYVVCEFVQPLHFLCQLEIVFTYLVRSTRLATVSDHDSVRMETEGCFVKYQAIFCECSAGNCGQTVFHSCLFFWLSYQGNIQKNMESLKRILSWWRRTVKMAAE